MFLTTSTTMFNYNNTNIIENMVNSWFMEYFMINLYCYEFKWLTSITSTTKHIKIKHPSITISTTTTWYQHIAWIGSMNTTSSSQFHTNPNPTSIGYFPQMLKLSKNSPHNWWRWWEEDDGEDDMMMVEVSMASFFFLFSSSFLPSSLFLFLFLLSFSFFSFSFLISLTYSFLSLFLSLSFYTTQYIYYIIYIIYNIN